MDIKKIAVIGGGIMGSGIAQVAASGGYEVLIYDLQQQSLEKGLNGIKKNLARDIKKERKTEDEVEKILGRISSSTDINDLSDVDAVIEAVFEKIEVKKEIFAQLDNVCKKDAYLITNTSGLSITEIAAVTERADKVIGMHFFNPVPVMKLVEIIKGYDTSEETHRVAMELGKAFGKDPITVEEAPLFAVNRILVPMINEAIFVLSEGTATTEDIDKGMKLGANHPIGPLALADMIGLETLLDVQETLYRETGDSKYRPATLLVKMVRAGHYGRKTGQGFYKYE
jgi:3-hydroxybutyryl-CoA dehydrogenase